MHTPPRSALAILVATVTIVALAGCSGGASEPAATAAPETATSDVGLVPEGTELTPVTTDAPSAADTTPPSTTSEVTSEVEVVAADDEPPIAGTSWSGTLTVGGGPDEPTTVSFDANGEVTLTAKGSLIPGVTWARTGDDVTITTDGGYATLTGTISGSTISVEGSNDSSQVLSLLLTKS